MHYPRLIRLLMDSSFRREEIKRVNQKAISKTSLSGLEREYTMREIAIITRAAPARALGLADIKGHLGVGADADVTIYTEDADREKMFNAPRYVIKSGHLIIKDYDFSRDYTGRLLHIEPAYDEMIEDAIEPFFESYYSIRFHNYAVADSYLHDHQVIKTGGE